MIASPRTSSNRSTRATYVPSGQPALRLSERLSLAFFGLVAAASGIGFAVSATFALVDALGGNDVHVSLSAAQAVPAGAATGTATLVSGTFDSANAVISGLDFTSRAFLAGGVLVTALMYLTLATAIVFVCISLFRSRPFSRSMTWALATASMTLIAGGLIGGGLTTAGQFMVAAQLNADPVGSVFPFAGSGDIAPLLFGLGLAAIAAAFELGERLQRNTERLQRDTEGLV